MPALGPERSGAIAAAVSTGALTALRRYAQSRAAAMSPTVSSFLTRPTPGPLAIGPAASVFRRSTRPGARSGVAGRLAGDRFIAHGQGDRLGAGVHRPGRVRQRCDRESDPVDAMQRPLCALPSRGEIPKPGADGKA